jgi:hypothetical protein
LGYELVVGSAVGFESPVGFKFSVVLQQALDILVVVFALSKGLIIAIALGKVPHLGVLIVVVVIKGLVVVALLVYSSLSSPSAYLLSSLPLVYLSLLLPLAYLSLTLLVRGLLLSSLAMGALLSLPQLRILSIVTSIAASDYQLIVSAPLT